MRNIFTDRDKQKEALKQRKKQTRELTPQEERKERQQRIWSFYIEEIKRAKQKAIDEYDLDLNPDDPELARDVKLKEISPVVKDIKKITEEFLADPEFREALNYRKEFIYPREWMRNDKRIWKKLEARPIIVDLLNYLYNYNRFLKGEDYRQTVEWVDMKMGGQKYTGTGEKHDFAVFVTDPNFWHELDKNLEYSEGYPKKVMKAFCDAGIIIKLKDLGREGTLYADGYYTQMPGNRKVKHPFLKKNKEFRKALREMTIK
ncbi:MAG: hypothetical protein SWH78_14840 [Thermodesulfobacteriota bacterium]|nr:hypothetical protein [Thermodesulfobacteriota bacterium]